MEQTSMLSTPQAPTKNQSRAATVAVVINTYNQAHYLRQSIESVLAQTCRPDQITVVDDGSSDDPSYIVAQYPSIKFVRQENQGLSASRNTGLTTASTDLIVFLDADDRLMPEAIALGLRQHAKVPGCGFVYGSYVNIGQDSRRLEVAPYRAADTDTYRTLLRGNVIGMHAAVMYNREVLVRHGGFDTSLKRCEDYDVYLKLARDEPVSSYPEIVAEYRRHQENMSHDHAGMLSAALRVLDTQQSRLRPGSNEEQALTEGRACWKRYFVSEAFFMAFASYRSSPKLVRYSKAMFDAVNLGPQIARSAALRILLAGFGDRLRARGKVVFAPALRPLRRWASAWRLDFGPFSRTQPVSSNFGFDRGTPIDRYYVENFLKRNASDIHGRTLEIGDASYTHRFGGAQVRQPDVLHVHPGNPHATIVGDLSDPHTLSENAFDCLILTQTLHLIYDVRAAVAAMHRALLPGGTVLLTVPGISQIDRGEWGSNWYWAITPAAATKLFGDVFGAENITVESHGNVYAATRFLQGLALDEVDRRKLDISDEAYPVIVTVRAIKRA